MRIPKLEWKVCLYNGTTILHSADAFVGDRYRILIRLRGEVYQNSFEGDVSLDIGHYTTDGQWCLERRELIGNFPMKMTLREAKKFSRYQYRKIYKNILRNSFTE